MDLRSELLATAKEMGIKEFSKKTGVNPLAATRWLKEGTKPNKASLDKYSDYKKSLKAEKAKEYRPIKELVKPDASAETPIDFSELKDPDGLGIQPHQIIEQPMDNAIPVRTHAEVEAMVRARGVPVNEIEYLDNNSQPSISMPSGFSLVPQGPTRGYQQQPVQQPEPIQPQRNFSYPNAQSTAQPINIPQPPPRTQMASMTIESPTPQVNGRPAPMSQEDYNRLNAANNGYDMPKPIDRRAVPIDVNRVQNGYPAFSPVQPTYQPQTFTAPNYVAPVALNGYSQQIALCMPWYKATNPVTSMLIAALGKRLGEKMLQLGNFGDAMIYNSRNAIADQFLQSNAEWSLWIDDDILMPIGNSEYLRTRSHIPKHHVEPSTALDTLTQLMSRQKSFVSATYWGRNPTGAPVFSEGLINPAVYRRAKNYTDEIIETDWCGMGCALVHRSVFTDIQRTHPMLAPGEGVRPEIDEMSTIENPRMIADHGNIKFWNFFKPRNGWGEDVMFCRRSKNAGHPVFVDLKLHAGHVGNMVWGAHNVAETLSSV